MKALIIAAGKGSRFQNLTKDEPKPLINLLGLSLLERVILTARKAGIVEFIIVLGFLGERIKERLGNGNNYGVNINYIENKEWQEGNGISVLAAKKVLNENFILLMADHIFDESILVRLKNERIADDEVMLAVDYNIKTNKLVDVNDVTKVLVKDDRILDVGKNIKKYNAYDTGIFLCSPAIFSAVKESSDDGDTSLTGGVRVLAKKGKVKALDIKDNFWIDVDDEKTFKKAKKLLQRDLIKPADGLISRHINREFSTRIFTPLLLKMHRGITPNQVSILSFIVGFISSLYFFLGHAIIGALLIQISSILDGCDGEIARLKHMQSSLGDFIDAVLDRYVDGFILLGIFYYSLTEIGDKDIFGFYWSLLIIFIIFGLAILGYLMVSYTSAKSVANFGYKYKGKLIAAGRGRDLRLFLLFIGGIMTYFHPIFVLFAVIVIAIQTNTIVILRTLLSWNYFLKKDSLMRSKIKTVIFDFDGTIANTMPFLTELGVKLMREKYNISKSEAEWRYLETTGLDFASQLELIFPNHPNNQEVANTFESKKIEGIFANPIFPEVIPTLKYFSKKKIKIFICSSTKQEIITKYAQLNRIDKQVDGLFGKKSDFGKSEQIDFVIQHHNLQPNEVLFIGDSLKDNDFAKDKKINFIGISMIFDKIEFQKRGVLSISCLVDLVELFDQSEKYFKSLEKIK